MGNCISGPTEVSLEKENNLPPISPIVCKYAEKGAAWASPNGRGGGSRVSPGFPPELHLPSKFSADKATHPFRPLSAPSSDKLKSVPSSGATSPLTLEPLSRGNAAGANPSSHSARSSTDSNACNASSAGGSSPRTPAPVVSHVSLLEHYSLGEQLGAGRFGTVLACGRKSDGRALACKIISNSLGARDAAMEVEVLQQLRGRAGIVQMEAVYVQLTSSSSGPLEGAQPQGKGIGKGIGKGFLRVSSINLPRGASAVGASLGAAALGAQRQRSMSSGCHPSGWKGALAGAGGALGRICGREEVQEVQIVMERCYGGTIADRLKEEGHFTEEQALRSLHSILCTVHLLHSQGFIYRDIKDTNFLFRTKEPDTTVVAIDFGLAAPFKPGQLLEEVAGSPLYIAPEVVRRAYGPQCDVWSAGVLFYQMLCGRHPFQRDSVTAVLKAVTSEGKTDLEAEPWPAVSAPTKHLLQAMLTRDPAARPTPAQLLACLSPDGAVVGDVAQSLRVLAASSSGEIEADGAAAGVVGAVPAPLGAD